MFCQKCQLKEAVTFNTEIHDGKVRILLVCRECFLPMREGVFSRITSEARRALIRASREMTDPKSANRIRPALLYFLLENEHSPLFEALIASGIDPAELRADIASYLGGENPEDQQWVSTRGITPAVVGARHVAQRLEHETVGTEHIFLGLIESP
ncbi:MAG: Clp protease N-terminal domain-containing protein, partial [Planctomycetota bacterium]